MSDETTRPTVPDPAAIRDAVTREAALKALHEEIGTALETARTDVQYLLDEQYKVTGTTKVDATLPGGAKVGSISRTGGEATAQITDADAFTAWVREAYPSEAITQIVKTVRARFTAQVLGALTATQSTQYADPGTGEVHDVPGVAIKPSRAAGHRITFARKSKAQPLDGRELVAEAWREGGLAAHVLPALAPAQGGNA
ncbi:hypothetical protein [Streptomyces sp. NPDC058254]|uniref:hypothetical protein n=1 Tax=Streptomyces sp. NPDC058254 TaxID=3346406 RepID=UPI0036E1B317